MVIIRLGISMAHYRLFIDEKHRLEIERVKRLIKNHPDCCWQEWNDVDHYSFKTTDPRDVLRIGVKSTLRYIEYPREHVVTKKPITYEWLEELVKITATRKLKYGCYLINE